VTTTDAEERLLHSILVVKGAAPALDLFNFLSF
jgi:hypothetical protein